MIFLSEIYSCIRGKTASSGRFVDQTSKKTVGNSIFLKKALSNLDISHERTICNTRVLYLRDLFIKILYSEVQIPILSKTVRLKGKYTYQNFRHKNSYKKGDNTYKRKNFHLGPKFISSNFHCCIALIHSHHSFQFRLLQRLL